MDKKLPALSAKQNAQLQVIATHPQAGLLASNRFSFGPNSPAKTLIDEHANAIQFGIVIENLTDVNQTIGFVPAGVFSGGCNDTIFDDIEELKGKMGVTALLSDGVILLGKDEHGDPNGKNVTVSTTDPKRAVLQLLRYMAKSPTRFTRWSMKSVSTAAGNPAESGNFDGVITSHFFSPFVDVPEKTLQMRPLQRPDAFQNNLMDIDFIRERFDAILSNEDFLSITVKAHTRLTIDMFIGAQASRAQEFYREAKAATQIIGTAMNV